jgi:hypothetical protein
VPFSTTLVPGTGSPMGSVTVPVIRFCAISASEQKQLNINTQSVRRPDPDNLLTLVEIDPGRNIVYNISLLVFENDFLFMFK